MKASEKILFAVMIIFIILLLLGMIAPRFFGGIDGSKKYFSARTKMTPIKSAINDYHLNTGEYPKTLDDLLSPPEELKKLWKGPYIKEKSLYDPYGHRYIYHPNGAYNPGSYDIISYGKDGKPGGEGYNADQHN